VNLGYKLRSRLRVSLQSSWGVTVISSVYCSTVSQWDYCYCYWVSSGTSWFSVRKLRSWSQVCTGPTMRLLQVTIGVHWL